jgi:hypothetical protein
MRDVEMALSRCHAAEPQPAAAEWNAALADHGWTQRRNELQNSTAGELQRNLLRPVLYAMGLLGRVTLQGALAGVQSPQRPVWLNLATGAVYEDGTGRVLEVQDEDLDDVYLPFEEPDATSRTIARRLVNFASY